MLINKKQVSWGSFLFFFIAITCFISINLNAQSKKYKVSTVMFTNCENFWDIYNSVDVVYNKYKFYNPLNRVSMKKVEAQRFVISHQREADSLGVKLYIDKQAVSKEFTPHGKKKWNSEKYNKKVKKIAEIIIALGQQSESKSAPVVVGMSEVENREVVEDLINTPLLKPYNFGIVHFNSNDSRGIDVCFIYQKSRFIVENSKKYIINLPANASGFKQKTRDIVMMQGKLDGENFTFLINHWPSRRGGEARSLPLRVKAAGVLKEIFKEQLEKKPNEKIIAMGDFNDDPVSPSIKKYLGATNKKKNLITTDIYSPMEDKFKRGMGTLAYKDAWNLFDQFFYSGNLVQTDKNFKEYKVLKTKIYSPTNLVTTEGQWKGYPKRSWNGDVFVEEGYSDHFPIYTVLLKEIN